MQQTLVLPYLRDTPLYIPRRDLVLGGADSVLLEVSIVESDTPCAPALQITGGIGGPALRMTVWPDTGRWVRDYGMWLPTCGTPIWSGVGTIDANENGTFQIRVPVATMTTWPVRCVYALQLDWDGATLSETLAQGVLIVRPFSVPGSFVPPRLTTDDLIPIDTDDNRDLYA